MLTNILKTDINWTAFREAYQVFALRGEGLNYYSDILDMDPEQDGNVSVVLRREGVFRVFYVLMRRSETAFSAMKAACLRHNGDYSIEEKDPATIPEEHFLQLIVNSAHNMPRGKFAWTNMDGRLFVRTDVQKRDWRGGTDAPGEIVCLEIVVEKSTLGTVLNARVATFTNESMFITKEERARFQEKFPKYVFTAKSVHRVRKDEDGPLYVRLNLFEKRNDISELSMRSLFDLEKSKQGTLQDIVEKLNARYKGLISFSFGEVKPAFIPILESAGKVNKAHKGSLPGRVPTVLIEGNLDDVEVIQSISLLKESLLSDFGYGEDDVRIRDLEDTPSDDTLRLCCIHDKGWYKERKIDDPHSSGLNSVQHFTVETILDPERETEPMAAVLLTELAIMQDIRDGKCTFFDMPDTWTVYKKCRMKTEDNKSGEEAANKKRKRAEEKAWYSSLTITKDGTIYGQAYPEDDFMILDVSEAFENFNVEYVFRNADGSIYPLWKTPVRSMADPDALKERMQAVENAETREYQVYEKEKVGGKDRYVLDENGNKIPKLDENGNPIIKKRRKNGGGWASYGVTTIFLRGFVEIGTFSRGNDLYYLCGQRPKGIKIKSKKIRNGVIIRRIADGQECREQFIDLLQTCPCGFIRAGELSVYPAIVKYLTLYTDHFAKPPV